MINFTGIKNRLLKPYSGERISPSILAQPKPATRKQPPVSFPNYTTRRSRLEIALVNPNTISRTRNIGPDKEPTLPICLPGKKARFRIGTLAIGTALLTPAIAIAGPLSLSALLIPSAPYLFAGGVFLAGATALFFAKSLYLNPRFGGRPGDPTARKIVTKFVLPTLGTVTCVGAALCASVFAAATFGLHSSTFLFGMGAIASTYTFGKMAISTVRVIIDHLRGKRKTIEKVSLKNRITTIVLSLNAQLSYALYTCTRALTFVAMTYGIAGHGFVNFIRLNFSPFAPVIGIGIGLLFGLSYQKKVAQRVNPHKAPNKMLWNATSAAACAMGGAAIATAFAAIGGEPLMNLLFAFALSTVEPHDALHAWKTLGGSRRVEDDEPTIYSDRQHWDSSSGPRGVMTLQIKPAYQNDIIPICWAAPHVRLDANWAFIQLNAGDYSDPTQIQTIWGMLKTYDQTWDMYKDWLQAADARLRSAVAVDEPLLATAAVYSRLAAAIDTPSADNNMSPAAEGNFAHLGARGFGDHTFTDPQPDDDHYRYIGKLMLTRAMDFRQRARELTVASTSIGTSVWGLATAPEAAATLGEELDGLYRCFNYPWDIYDTSFDTDLMPEMLITKIEQLDAYNERSATTVTGVKLLRRDPVTGDVIPKTIPCNVTKDLVPNYREVRNIESRPREDNRFHWFVRRPHEIGESHSPDVAYLDMEAYYRAHNDLEHFPTARIHDIPKLQGEQYYELVFKNGSRLRYFGDRRRISIGNVPASADTLYWLPGEEPPADLASLSDHAYGYSYAFYLEEPFSPRFQFFFQTEVQEISDLEHLAICVKKLATRLQQNHAMPYAHFQFKIPEDLDLPYDPQMQDGAKDQLLQVAQGSTWFMLQAKDTSGRTLYFPWNIRKGSYDLYPDAKNHPNAGWEDIDENVPVKLVKRGERVDPSDPPCPYDYAMVITYQNGSHRDDTYSDGNIYKRYPFHMGDPGQYADQEAFIDLHRGHVGVMPVLKFVFLKRDETSGEILYRGGSLPDATWNVFMKKIISEHQFNAMDPTDRSGRPFVDENDFVHIPTGISVPPEVPQSIDSTSGDTLIDIFSFREFQRSLRRETLYERFIPQETFANYFDAGTIQLQEEVA